MNNSILCYILQKNLCLVMKKLSLFSLIFFLSVVSFAQYNLENLSLVSESKIKNYTYENLRLYPIFANDVFLDAHKNIGNYTILKEALEQKKIIITEQVIEDSTRNENIDPGNDLQQLINESNNVDPNINIQQNIIFQQIQQSVGSGGRVNTLFIENVSNDTVYIMAGEVVKGGKQDRVIAKDMIIPPLSGKIDLSVFCVEKGRWNFKGENSKSFNGYYNVSSMQIRKAIDTKQEQGKVWEAVDVVTSKNSAQSNTGTYTALDSSRSYKNEIEKYLNYFENKFTDESKVIGVVVTTADRIIGCDMFATPDLFKKQFSNLLHSYATDAITEGKTVSIEQKKVDDYLFKLLSDESSQDEVIEKNGAMFKRNGKKIHITSY